MALFSSASLNPNTTWARYYEAQTGRFIQTDPEPGVLNHPITSVNRYVYAGNDGINNVDPTGRFLGKIVGSVTRNVSNFIDNHLGGHSILLGLMAAVVGPALNISPDLAFINASGVASGQDLERINRGYALAGLVGLGVATGTVGADDAGLIGAGLGYDFISSKSYNFDRFQDSLLDSVAATIVINALDPGPTGNATLKNIHTTVVYGGGFASYGYDVYQNWGTISRRLSACRIHDGKPSCEWTLK